MFPDRIHKEWLFCCLCELIFCDNVAFPLRRNIDDIVGIGEIRICQYKMDHRFRQYQMDHRICQYQMDHRFRQMVNFRFRLV